MVLGAGLAGVGCYHACPGAQIFEAREAPGGHAASRSLLGFDFDEGAHIVHSRDPEFTDRLGTAWEALPWHDARVANLADGRWLGYPIQNHLHGLPPADRDLALRDLLGAHGQAHSPPRDYLQWCQQHYGDYLTQTFYRRYTQKYWRCAMPELATDWLSGRLLRPDLERVQAGAQGPLSESQTRFARFGYPQQGGFFQAFAGLYAGVPVRYGHRAVELDLPARRIRWAHGASTRYRYLASSVPLPALVDLIREVPTEVRRAARALRWTRSLLIDLVVAKPHLTDLHWFYLYDLELEASRVSLPSNLSDAPAAQAATALQAEIFRLPEEPFAQGLIDRTVQQLAQILGFSLDQVAALSSREVPWGYVISDHQRARSVQTVQEWLQSYGVHPIGLYGKWRFMWSDQAFLDGLATGRELLERGRA